MIGSVAPAITVEAHRTGISLDRAWVSGRPVVLVFHGRENRDVARGLVQAVRNVHTHATSVVTANIVDLSPFPRTMRRVVRHDLDKAFEHAVVNLSGDRDPESHVIIVPDHKAEVVQAFGVEGCVRTVAAVVLDGDWRIRLQATEPGLDRAVLRALEEVLGAG